MSAQEIPHAHSASRGGYSGAAYPAAAGSSGTGAWIAAAIVIAISLLSTFTISTDDSQNVAAGGGQGLGPGVFSEEVVGGDVTGGAGPQAGGRRVVGGAAGTEGVAGTEGSEGSASGGGTEGTEGGTQEGGPGSGTSDDCKVGNAGATETGVTKSEVHFAATVVTTGIAKSFLSDAQHGINAAVQKVNRGGDADGPGVCKRLVRVKFDNDGWEPSRGQRTINGYIVEKKYFGLAVNPSSEGLRGAIDSGDIERNGFPVIGADGMLLGQYTNPWVWPVATSTHSVMHIMCKEAYDRGARTFGLVWENNYRFGVEGAKAFKGCVKRLGGTQLVGEAEIQGGLPSYKNKADTFVGACSHAERNLSKCDFIALLLEPATATAWHQSGGMGSGDANKTPKKGFGAPQPLFVTSFVKGCGKPCATLRVWTSFKPPIDPFDKDPAVVAYLNDLRGVSDKADASNPHVQGAYVGMLLAVHALEEMGPAPTREKARALLDRTTFDTGLSPPLTFAPDNHFAAVSAQAFDAIFNDATFSTWRYANTGFKKDTEVKKDQ